MAFGDGLARADLAQLEGLHGAERSRVLEAARFGRMRVVDTARGAGRLYACPCGLRVWSAYGHAQDHAQRCGRADVAGAVAEARAAL